jgi:hypothetical protein
MKMQLTNTSYRLSLIADLGTEEISFACDENRQYGTTEDRYFDETEEEPDHVVDAFHLSNGGAIRTLNHVVGTLPTKA